MSTSISWTDDSGSATLTNGKNAPANRFSGWTPRSVPFTGGAEVNTLADATLYVFELREDHSASFSLPFIPYSSLGLMLRLQNHLASGGEVSVTTGDSLSSVYANCKQAEGAETTFDLVDKALLEYTMYFNLLNVATSRVPMVCVY